MTKSFKELVLGKQLYTRTSWFKEGNTSQNQLNLDVTTENFHRQGQHRTTEVFIGREQYNTQSLTPIFLYQELRHHGRDD